MNRRGFLALLGGVAVAPITMALPLAAVPNPLRAWPGDRFEAYTSYFRRSSSLLLPGEWRYAVRIANIDTRSAA